MDALRQKLHSQRGSSMLMALLFFLLVSMVGAVILAAASANADKLIDRQAEQQDYLAISSAARLLRDSINGTGCSAVEFQTIYDCAGNPNVTDHHTAQAGIRQEMTAADSDGRLQDYLATLAHKMYLSQSTTYLVHTTPPAMPVHFTVEAEGMKSVKVKLTMATDYALALELRMEASPYVLLLNFPASVVTPDAAVSSNTTCTHHWTETQQDPITGETVEVPVSQSFTITDSARTTTITWSNGIIGKGVSAGG